MCGLQKVDFMPVNIWWRLFKQAELLGHVYCMSHGLWVSSLLVCCLSNNTVLFIFAPCIINEYRIFSNLIRTIFYSFRGLKNQMRVRIACGLNSRSWAGFWKNDRAAVRAVRTIKYYNLLFILYSILYNIYNLLFIRLAVITHNWISLPCRQGAVEGKVRIRTAN